MINFTLLCFILFFNVLSYSQQPNTIIEKSKEKIIINGKIYYLHTIKSGQTLYSISKAYNITIDEILSANPGLNPTQIKEGTSIKIPENNQQKNENNNSEINNDYIYHKVKQGETLYFLSKKYNITIDDIIKYNPGLETLKADQIVKIPKQVKNIKADTLKYIIYELNKKDTLYSIAKRYNTSVSEIIELNPELKNGIKKGLKIKIPIKEDSLKYTTESLIDCNSKPEIKKEIRYAILIPKISNLNNLDYNTEKITRFYNFYKGVLLALDSIKNEGKSVSLKIFEIEEKYNTNTLNNLIKFTPDFIINFNVELDSFSYKAFLEKNIPLIYPLDVNQDIYKFKNLIKLIPNKYYYFDYILNYLKQEYNSRKINLIIINDKQQGKEINSDSLIKNRKKIENLKISIINDSILFNVQKSLDSLNKNIIFINSVNEGLVSILLSRLNLQQKIYDINVFGLSDWFYFNKIETEILHKLNTKILTPFYIDYNSKKVKSFLYKNINMYGYEPPRNNFSDILTFLGFDIILLSKELSISYVDIRCLKEHVYDGLLSSYILFKTDDNITINKSYYVITYEKDYTIKKELKTLNGEEKILTRKNKNNF